VSLKNLQNHFEPKACRPAAIYGEQHVKAHGVLHIPNYLAWQKSAQKVFT
jgi:hypothetical protein